MNGARDLRNITAIETADEHCTRGNVSYGAIYSVTQHCHTPTAATSTWNDSTLDRISRYLRRSLVLDDGSTPPSRLPRVAQSSRGILPLARPPFPLPWASQQQWYQRGLWTPDGHTSMHPKAGAHCRGALWDANCVLEVKVPNAHRAQQVVMATRPSLNYPFTGSVTTDVHAVSSLVINRWKSEVPASTRDRCCCSAFTSAAMAAVRAGDAVVSRSHTNCGTKHRQHKWRKYSNSNSSGSCHSSDSTHNNNNHLIGSQQRPGAALGCNWWQHEWCDGSRGRLGDGGAVGRSQSQCAASSAVR